VITLVVAAVMAGSSFAQRLPKGHAEDLVQQLATNKSASPPVAELEHRIVALGIKALAVACASRSAHASTSRGMCRG
jgi:hypothetical protein